MKKSVKLIFLVFLALVLLLSNLSVQATEDQVIVRGETQDELIIPSGSNDILGNDSNVNLENGTNGTLLKDSKTELEVTDEPPITTDGTSNVVDTTAEETKIENNDEKLPQTGEEINTLSIWLSIIIVIGVLCLGSILLIERKRVIKK